MGPCGAWIVPGKRGHGVVNFLIFCVCAAGLYFWWQWEDHASIVGIVILLVALIGMCYGLGGMVMGVFSGGSAKTASASPDPARGTSNYRKQPGTITNKQYDFICSLCDELDIDVPDGIDDFSVEQASARIERLIDRRDRLYED